MTPPASGPVRGAWGFIRSAQGRLAIGVVLLELVAAVQTFMTSTLLPVIVTGLHAQHQLGLLVAGTAIGLFVGLPAAGPAIRRFGVSRTVFAAASGYLGGTGLSAAYAFFAVAATIAVAASTRLAPVRRYEDPRGADALTRTIRCPTPYSSSGIPTTSSLRSSTWPADGLLAAPVSGSGGQGAPGPGKRVSGPAAAGR